MKILADMLAVILFFAAYFYYKDIIIATVVAVVIGVLQAAWFYFTKGKLDKLQIFSLAIVLIFGGLTIFLGDPVFIKWKPTLLFFSFSVGILFGGRFNKDKRGVLESLMGDQMKLPPEIWKKLTWMWSAFFLFLAVANLVVVYVWWGNDDLWVNYKTFGATSFSLIFFIAQSFWLSKHIIDESAPIEAAADGSPGQEPNTGEKKASASSEEGSDGVASPSANRSAVSGAASSEEPKT